MRIHFKGTNYELSPEISRFAQKKIETLKKYVKRKDGVAQAFVNMGRITTAQNTGKIWSTELNFDVDGKRFNAAATADNLESAIEVAVSEVGTELEKMNKRDRQLVRRGGSVIKSFMRGFQT